MRAAALTPQHPAPGHRLCLTAGSGGAGEDWGAQPGAAPRARALSGLRRVEPEAWRDGTLQVRKKLLRREGCRLPATAAGRTGNNRVTFQQRKVRLIIWLGSHCAGRAGAFPSSEGFLRCAGLSLVRVNAEGDPASGQAQGSVPSPGFAVGEAHCWKGNQAGEGAGEQVC